MIHTTFQKARGDSSGGLPSPHSGPYLVPASSVTRTPPRQGATISGEAFRWNNLGQQTSAASSKDAPRAWESEPGAAPTHAPRQDPTHSYPKGRGEGPVPSVSAPERGGPAFPARALLALPPCPLGFVLLHCGPSGRQVGLVGRGAPPLRAAPSSLASRHPQRP